MLVAGGFIAFAVAVDRALPPSLVRADGVVSLTGGSQRIGEGISLLHRGLGTRLLITGVNERTSHDEVQKIHPSAKSLMACCVDLGAQARNTIGNAIETRKWLKANGFSSLTVVTSRYHMPRTMLEFRHAMPGAVIHPHLVTADMGEQAAWWSEPGMVRTLALEYVKYLVARLRVQFEKDPETSRLAIIFGGRKPISPKIVSGTFVEAAN